jgi:hypothetical protein
VGLLLVSTEQNYAQESPAFEKIRDVSPDGKFAVRISCSSDPEDPEHIERDVITAFTAKCDQKTGKFQIASKKKIPSTE